MSHIHRYDPFRSHSLKPLEHTLTWREDEEDAVKSSTK
jgi:hypothetical protein